jgi:hypothetical protein
MEKVFEIGDKVEIRKIKELLSGLVDNQGSQSDNMGIAINNMEKTIARLFAIESCGLEQIPAIVEKLFAIEKRQDKQSTTNELIVDKLEEFMKRQDAQKKRMDFIEAIQKGEIPEDKTMNNPIQIYISRGDVSHQKKVDDPIDGMKFAKKVLDSMRNKGDLKE